MQLAGFVVHLVEIGCAVGKPHALAPDVVAQRVHVEMVVGRAIDVITDLFDKPPVVEALEAPTVIAVDQDLTGPSGVRFRRVGLVHAPHLVAPNGPPLAVDAAMRRKNGMLCIGCHLEQAVERRHGRMSFLKRGVRRTGWRALNPRLRKQWHRRYLGQAAKEGLPEEDARHGAKFRNVEGRKARRGYPRLSMW